MSVVKIKWDFLQSPYTESQKSHSQFLYRLWSHNWTRFRLSTGRQGKKSNFSRSAPRTVTPCSSPWSTSAPGWPHLSTSPHFLSSPLDATRTQPRTDLRKVLAKGRLRLRGVRLKNLHSRLKAIEMSGGSEEVCCSSCHLLLHQPYVQCQDCSSNRSDIEESKVNTTRLPFRLQ